MGTPATSQLELFDPRAWAREDRLAAARRLADDLSHRLAEPVRLLVHDNRSTMLSFRRQGGRLCYRLHHMFLDAPAEVVEAVATFAAGAGGDGGRRRAASDLIDDYVRRHRLRIGTPRVALLRQRGQVHDLQAIFDRLNESHFQGEVQAGIGWGANRGAGGASRRRRSIKTGVYLHEARLIRIHPALDRPEVPELYVAAVVFHEMLHQVVPALERGGRRLIHGPEFRRRERAYPDHDAARRWERANLGMLLSA